MNMKELAAICDVSPATISYALRDDSRISETVRLRIQAKARELNYRPDSNSSALVRYRQLDDSKVKQPTVGIVYAHPRSSRRTKLFQAHVSSFRKSINHYGYELKEYFLEKKADAEASLLSQLRAHETQGLMLAWGEWEDRLKDFPWEEFTVVSAERNEIHPSLDRVSANHFTATEVALEQLEIRGAQRIGLVCHHDLPVRVKKNIIGAYIQHIDSTSGLTKHFPPYFYEIGDSPEKFESWLQRNKLDAIVSHRQIELGFFRKLGLRFPTDVQYAVIEIDDNKGDNESGIIMDEDMGQVLAEVITGKLHYGETVDLKHEGNLTLVNGQWRNGKTTYAKSKAQTEHA